MLVDVPAINMRGKVDDESYVRIDSTHRLDSNANYFDFLHL